MKCAARSKEYRPHNRYHIRYLQPVFRPLCGLMLLSGYHPRPGSHRHLHHCFRQVPSTTLVCINHLWHTCTTTMHPAMHQSPAVHMFYNSRPNPYTNDYHHQRRTVHQPRPTQLDQGVHTGQTVDTSGSRQHSNAQPQQPPQEHHPQTNCQSTEPILGCRDHMKDSPFAAEQTCAGLTVNLSTSPCAPDSPTPSVPAPVSPILDPSIPVGITSHARMPASPKSNIEVNDSPAARSHGKQRYIEYQELLVKLPPIKCNKNDDLLVDLSSAPRISSSPADLPFLEGTVNLNLAL